VVGVEAVAAREKPTLSGPIAERLRQRLPSASFTTRQLVGELQARGLKTDRRAEWVCHAPKG
jgi:hypothetical protein